MRTFCISFQRFRYHEAYQVNLLLQKAEQGHISENSVAEDVLSRMRSTSHWRAGLVVSCLNHFFSSWVVVCDGLKACSLRKHFYI